MSSGTTHKTTETVECRCSVGGVRVQRVGRVHGVGAGLEDGRGRWL